MKMLVIGAWIVTLVWLAVGFLVFRFVIESALRDKGVSRPHGFRPPNFVGNHSRELTAYRTQRRRAGRGIAWWRFMMAWRVLFGVLAVCSIVITFIAALEMET